MRKKWMWYINNNAPSKTNDLRTFFNFFIKNHSGYRFTVAKIYSGLYELGITSQQHEGIKRQLEKIVKIPLPDARLSDVIADSGSLSRRSFGSLQQFRYFQDSELPKLNQTIVKKKLVEVKAHYKQVMKLFKEIRGGMQIVSFDIEVYEHDHDVMLEIGYTIVTFSSQTGGNGRRSIEDSNARHFIIEENIRYENKDHVPNNRDGFRFGTSSTVTLNDALEMFHEDIEECHFLLGHSIKHDHDYLKNIGVDLTELGIEMLDTQLIQMHGEINDTRFDMRGLSYLLREHGIDFEDKDLHNGGNDAYYTMMAFLRQMGYSKATVNGLSAHF